MNPVLILCVAGGGAIGAVLRYIFGIALQQFHPSAFPYQTMLINIIGSCIMGALVESMALHWSPSLELRSFLTAGLLGGFTTFSAFSLDGILLLERGQIWQSAFYICGSVALSLLGLWLGMNAVRMLTV